jgi:hypothetical protein
MEQFMDGDEDPETREKSNEEPRETRRPALQDGTQRRELAFEDLLQRFLRRSATTPAPISATPRAISPVSPSVGTGVTLGAPAHVTPGNKTIANSTNLTAFFMLVSPV